MLEEVSKTDEEICQLVQKGNIEIFGVLVERYEEKLKRYAFKFLNQKEDVEDVVQNVFLKTFENIQGFDTKRKFQSWIYRIAHNELVNFLKKKKKLTLSLIELDTFLPSSLKDDTLREEVDFDLTEKKELLEKFLEELEPKYKEPLYFYYFENLSYAEISEILRIPISTVGVRIQRAKEKIKKKVKEKYGDKWA